MNNKTHTKSILIGLLAGIVVTIAVGAGLPTNREVGRYQVAGAGNGNAVIVDTVTGQSWQYGFGNNGAVGGSEGFFQSKSVEK